MLRTGAFPFVKVFRNYFALLLKTPCNYQRYLKVINYYYIIVFLFCDFSKFTFQILKYFDKEDFFALQIFLYIVANVVAKFAFDKIICEKNSAKKVKLIKVEKSLDMQIKKLDEQLYKLKQEKEEEIFFEIEKLKSDINNLEKYKDISRVKRLGFYLMLGSGYSIFLFPLLFMMTVIFDPSWLVEEGIAAGFILTLISIIFTYAGILLTRPGRRVLKLKALKDNLYKLENT